MAQTDESKEEKGPAAGAGEEALPPLVPAAVRGWARSGRRVLAFLLPPALMLGLGAGMLGWISATAAAVLLPGKEIHPMGVAFGFGRWTLVAGLGLCVITQGLHQARLRWRAPIRFR
ncbi:MAG TPA: hypothetical protein VF746_14680 [Longimicrobium sp.]|jgi:hypothetical protein